MQVIKSFSYVLQEFKDELTHPGKKGIIVIRSRITIIKLFQIADYFKHFTFQKSVLRRDCSQSVVSK